MQFYKKNPILRFLGQTAGVKINKLERTLGLNANSTEFKKVSGSDCAESRLHVLLCVLWLLPSLARTCWRAL